MPIQSFVINKENERVEHKMYDMFLHTLKTFNEFITIPTAKYDGEFNTLHAFDNKDSHDLSLFTVETVNCQFFTIRYI